MLALLQYFQRRSVRLRAFKAGPDFIDPLWHRAVTGRPSYNLDTHMIGAEKCRRLLAQHAADAEFSLIEGVMGLFDGRAGVGGEGSSVHLAAVLQCPVLLVVDVSGMSGTLAAIVAGCRDLAARSDVRISGVIANRVGSAQHAAMLSDILTRLQLPPIVAWMERHASELGERHLGLVCPDSNDVPDFASSLHVDEVLLAQVFADVVPEDSEFEPTPQLLGKSIAVAKDDACCFIYPANLDWLAAQGAEVSFFSPIAGEAVPDSADAVWLPGGYPELYAEPLSRSASWVSLRACAVAGMPVLAECGGAMLLGDALTDPQGRHWTMAGLLPYISVMQPRLAALGYRHEASGVMGHEFHYSVRQQEADLPPAFLLDSGDSGIRCRNIRASYIHWYFASGENRAAHWFLAE